MLRVFMISVAYFVFASGCGKAPKPKLDPVEAKRRECERTAYLPMPGEVEAKFDACKDVSVKTAGIENFWTFFYKCLNLLNTDFTINLDALEMIYCEMGQPFTTPRDCAAKIKESSLRDAAQKLRQCQNS